ncbi:hypothetical protein J588_1284 [Acinetobacter sp. 1578804]|nr:hypothetical protein J588_4058 [Acinetobacter sp. 1578804]EXE91712.1 hypothetical protein J588_1511 [Acinetobacter sp. 1578804]EXE92045.1 hypothetical protein J588_1284 [Acinetobacter sp. 1578804]
MRYLTKTTSPSRQLTIPSLEEKRADLEDWVTLQNETSSPAFIFERSTGIIFLQVGQL